MIELFEASVIKFIKEKFMENFGLSVPFKFSPQMDFIEEFRKDRFSKIAKTETSNLVESLIEENNKDLNFAIWKRSPVKKMIEPENGITPPRVMGGAQVVLETPDGFQVRDFFYGKVDFNVQFFSSEAKIMYMVELLYNSFFYLNNPDISIVYSLDGYENELEYQTYFNELDSIEFIDTNSYGSMQLIEFSFSVYGLFFSPYYYLEELNTIKEIDLRVLNYNIEDDLDVMKSYSLQNYDKSRLACSETCQVNQDNHLIDENTCISLHQENDSE